MPPCLDADAAKMTARDPSIAEAMVLGSVTSHIMVVSRGLLLSPLKIPDREVARTGMERSRQALMHSMPVLPLDPITQIGSAVEDDFSPCAAKAVLVVKSKLIPVEAATAAADLVESTRNSRLSLREDGDEVSSSGSLLQFLLAEIPCRMVLIPLT